MVQQCKAELIEVVPLTNSILKLKLKPSTFIDYQPGQYLNIILDDESLSYSIANAPLGAPHYELHIRHTGDDPYEQPLFSHLKKQGGCQIALPFGECYLGNLDLLKPIIFIAAGTGFAPIKAMIEAILAHNDPRHVTLFWGAKESCDIYQQQLVNQWQSHVDRLTVHTVIDDKRDNALIREVLKLNQKQLSTSQFVISGPFPMVYSARDELVMNGISIESMHADAFAFETPQGES